MALPFPLRELDLPPFTKVLDVRGAQGGVSSLVPDSPLGLPWPGPHVPSAGSPSRSPTSHFSGAESATTPWPSQRESTSYLQVGTEQVVALD